MAFYGLDQLDQKIAQYVPETAGVFVELGAFDGVTQSNSRYFEELGWTGVLIEPQPEAFARCVANRPRSQVFNCACVPNGFTAPTVEMVAVGLMSVVKGSLGSQLAEDAWIERGERVQTISRAMIVVQARTLDSILDEACVSGIDLLILDVEGGELDVLKGMDLRKRQPRFIVCEDSYSDHVADYLTSQGYIQHATLSARPYTRDILYRPIDTTCAKPAPPQSTQEPRD